MDTEAEPVLDEMSPSASSLTETTLYRRKSTKGSSFVSSEKEKEEESKAEEEVRCLVSSK